MEKQGCWRMYNSDDIPGTRWTSRGEVMELTFWGVAEPTPGQDNAIPLHTALYGLCTAYVWDKYGLSTDIVSV